jgi:hypothetical protein
MGTCDCIFCRLLEAAIALIERLIGFEGVEGKESEDG